jgi:hypothetical protein
MKIRWSIDGDEINLQLEVSASLSMRVMCEITLRRQCIALDAAQATATGWVGFGLAETSGMAGADIVYYEAAGNRLVDAHALQYGKPAPDPCQDWKLVAARQENSKLIVDISRKLISGDTMDRNLTYDAAPMFPTPVIAAWGDSAQINYHCPSCRGILSQ